MNIEKHIRQLLFEQNCVIIPEFGGFIANYVSAEIHPIRHVFAPPSKYIAFNELLKVNDGLLISHIASNEDISRDDATKAVKEFVIKISEAINNNKKYYFEQIGNLYLNHEQKLQFDPDKTINYLSASFGLPDLIYKPIERQINPLRVKDRPVIKSEVNEVIQKDTINELSEQRKRTFSKFQAALIPVLIFLAVAFGYFCFLDNGDNALSSFNPIPAKLLGIFHKKKIVTDNKNVAIVLPETTAVKKSEKTDMIAAEIETEKAKPVIKEEVIKKEKPKKIVKKISKSSVRYYVIVGGFSSEANAEKLVTKLKEEGNNNAKVLPPVANNLHKVSLGDFETSNEAESKSKEIKYKFSNAWIYKN